MGLKLIPGSTLHSALNLMQDALHTNPVNLMQDAFFDNFIVRLIAYEILSNIPNGPDPSTCMRKNSMYHELKVPFDENGITMTIGDMLKSVSYELREEPKIDADEYIPNWIWSDRPDYTEVKEKAERFVKSYNATRIIRVTPIILMGYSWELEVHITFDAINSSDLKVSALTIYSDRLPHGNNILSNQVDAYFRHTFQRVGGHSHYKLRDLEQLSVKPSKSCLEFIECLNTVKPDNRAIVELGS